MTRLRCPDQSDRARRMAAALGIGEFRSDVPELPHSNAAQVLYVTNAEGLRLAMELRRCSRMTDPAVTVVDPDQFRKQIEGGE